MSRPDELEALLRRIVREELERVFQSSRLAAETPANDEDADLRELVAERAAKLRRARGASK